MANEIAPGAVVAESEIVNKDVTASSRSRVVTVAEAGEMLGLGRAAAYEAVKRGELPTLRFGRRIVVPRAALLRLLDCGAPPKATG
jgi:excisionase family DNA binding protein